MIEPYAWVDNPKDEFWHQEHGRGQTYDRGHRDAIDDMLKALTVLAARQYQRSGATANRKHWADEYDRRYHERDGEVARALQILVDNYYGPKDTKT